MMVKNHIFSGYTPERKKNIKRRKFDEKIYEYTYTPKANVSEGRTAIRLKGKIDQNVKHIMYIVV